MTVCTQEPSTFYSNAKRCYAPLMMTKEIEQNFNATL